MAEVPAGRRYWRQCWQVSISSMYLQLHRAEDAEASRLLPSVAALVDAGALHELNDCIHEIASRLPVATAALLSWLAVSPIGACADALLRTLSVNHLSATEPANFNLSGVDAGAAILTCGRLCARATAPAVTLGWLLALFSEIPPTDPQRLRLNALLAYHAEEVPDTTMKLLGAVSPAQLPAEADAFLNHLLQEDALLRDAPRLTELALAREERYSLANLERDRQRDIQRHARQRSIFLQFTKPHHVKYSTRVAIEVDLGSHIQEQTLELQQHGVAVEMPLSERARPLLGKVLRHRLWEGEF